MKRLLIIVMLPLFTFSQSLVVEVNDLFAKKQYKEAEKRAAQYVSKNPDDVTALELLGDAYGHQKKWDEAVAIYKKLAQSHPNQANYHYKYGGALGMKALQVNQLKALGMIGDIKRAFLEAVRLDPKHIDARWALVELYMQLPGILGGSTEKSLAYANQLEQLSKVDGYLAKGYIYEYDNEPEQAEYFYKKAIEVGGSITCFDKLINFYEASDQPEKAIQTLEVSYDKHKRNALHYQIGKVCADYNLQLEKGERCLKQYIANYSAEDGVPIEWAYYRLAQIEKNKLNKAEALNWIDKALEIRADFKQAKEEKQKILLL